MTGATRLDACRDAAALIRATRDHDHHAATVILDHSDNREVAEVLAVLVVGMCSGLGAGFLPDLLTELRQLDT